MLESSMGFACNDSHVFNASAVFLRGEMQALEAQHNRRVKRADLWRRAPHESSTVPGATACSRLLYLSRPSTTRGMHLAQSCPYGHPQLQEPLAQGCYI